MTMTKQTTLYNYYTPIKTTPPVPAKRWKLVFKTSLDMIDGFHLCNATCDWCDVKINKRNECEDYDCEEVCNKCYEENNIARCESCYKLFGDGSDGAWSYEYQDEYDHLCLDCEEVITEQKEEEEREVIMKVFKTVLREIKKRGGNPLNLKDELPEEFLNEVGDYEYIENEEFTDYIHYLEDNDLYGEPHIWKEYQANLIFQKALRK